MSILKRIPKPKEIKLVTFQFDRLMTLAQHLVDAVRDHRKVTSEGFAKVAEAVSKLQPPEPPPDLERWTILARYKFNEDQPEVSFDIIAKGFQSAKGTPVSAADIDLSVSSSSAQLTAELSGQTLSEDGLEVKATVTLRGQAMPVNELAVVTYVAKNRDTGNQVAADVDEFETGAGEATIGTIESPVPLTEA